MSQQFSLPLGEARKLEGIGLVASNNDDWMARALSIVAQYAPWGCDFMAEEFQTYPHIGQPRHPNAWGALTRMARSRHIIIPTGRYAKSSRTTNNAHPYMIYRR